LAVRYAGILGLLAFLTSSARGLIHGGEVQSILLAAWLSLLVFAAVGGVVGWIAERAVEESVRSRIKDALAAEEGAADARKT